MLELDAIKHSGHYADSQAETNRVAAQHNNRIHDPNVRSKQVWILRSRDESLTARELRGDYDVSAAKIYAHGAR